MQVHWKQLIGGTIIAGAFTLQGYTINKQQDAIDGLIGIAMKDMELDAAQETKLWDLHRRVVLLEQEDERIMAHVRWFVMRRSGTDELRKMEATVERLENAD